MINDRLVKKTIDVIIDVWFRGGERPFDSQEVYKQLVIAGEQPQPGELPEILEHLTSEGLIGTSQSSTDRQGATLHGALKIIWIS